MIAKMSKYDFVLYAAQSTDFIERLRELGLVDLTTTGWEPSEEDRQLLADIEGHTKSKDMLRKFAADPTRCEASVKPFATGAEAYAHYLSTTQSAAVLTSEIARLEKLSDELRPWGEFSMEAIGALVKKGIVLHYFSTPRSTFDKQVADWQSRYFISLINEQNSNAYFVALSAPGEEMALDAQEMKAPLMDCRQAEHRVVEAQVQLRELDKEFARCAASLALIEADEAALRERLQDVQVTATAQAAAEGTLTVMEGWAETETSTKVDALLAEYPNVIYLKRDPTPEDDTPVKLKNSWFPHVFEMVGDMYARPKYGTMDLTPFFAPFYMLFFGICLNDAGYGLVLLILGLVMLKKSKEPIMRRAAWFATLCAISTTLFGGFCGSFFGLSMSEWFPSFPFFDFQGKFFSVALAIGMVQILFGMVLKIIMITGTVGFKFALSSLGWFLVLFAGSLAGGLPMLNPDWVIPFFTLSSPAFYASLALSSVLMLFFNSPGKNPFLNVGLGLWETYNNITGILSDVLSYIRLFAIGLSGGILATVFNALADGFVPDGSNIVVRLLIMIPILLIGHGINLFMSTISSFVHPMRLTFVEFYKNAGFDMAVRKFEPLQKIQQTESK